MIQRLEGTRVAREPRCVPSLAPFAFLNTTIADCGCGSIHYSPFPDSRSIHLCSPRFGAGNAGSARRKNLDTESEWKSMQSDKPTIWTSGRPRRSRPLLRNEKQRFIESLDFDPKYCFSFEPWKVDTRARTGILPFEERVSYNVNLSTFSEQTFYSSRRSSGWLPKRNGSAH